MDTTQQLVDVLIIGGGINGAGIARDAAGRGLNVALYDMHDFASGTSSYSSKLIHGGLRYLEQYDFKLVHDALKERSTLLSIAPELIHPIEFSVPLGKHSRHPALIRLGLFIYDYLYLRNNLKKSRVIRNTEDSELKGDIKTIGLFSDCMTDDSRLVLANILDAEKRGATVRNYCKVKAITLDQTWWEVSLEDTLTGESFKQHAKCIINTSGPWLMQNEASWLPQKRRHQLKLIKGSHILIKSPFSSKKNYLLQHQDGRVVFVIQYVKDFLLIGTTEVEIDVMPNERVKCSYEEKSYLIDLFNQYFNTSISLDDICHDYAGVRPLLYSDQDPQHLSRDCIIEKQLIDGLPFMSVLGGKITSYRKTSENALNLLEDDFVNMTKAWTAETPFAPQPNAITTLLKNQSNTQICSENLYRDLESNLAYFIQSEHAKTLNDILWRRTKLGYFLHSKHRDLLQNSFKSYVESKQT